MDRCCGVHRAMQGSAERITVLPRSALHELDVSGGKWLVPPSTRRLIAVVTPAA